MKEELIIAGFGGQGVLSMGKILAYGALMEGREVTWMPAYGPEQRGGTANVTVIISDQSISSPILSTFDTAIILNQPSLDRFQDAIRPGGTLIYDSYGICDKFQCEGVLDIVRAFRDADPDDDWFLCSYYDYVTSSCYAADLIDVNSFVSDIIHGYADIDCDEIKRLIDLDNEVALTSVLMSKRKWEDADGTTKTVVFVELEYEDGSDNRIDFDTLDDAFDAFCKYAELLDE